MVNMTPALWRALQFWLRLSPNQRKRLHVERRISHFADNSQGLG
jgi:hypothetical protein